jgi:hypothetical protein
VRYAGQARKRAQRRRAQGSLPNKITTIHLGQLTIEMSNEQLAMSNEQ